MLVFGRYDRACRENRREGGLEVLGEDLGVHQRSIVNAPLLCPVGNSRSAEPEGPLFVQIVCRKRSGFHSIKA